MTDRQLYVHVTYDDVSMDATIVFFRDRAPLPVDTHCKRLECDIQGLDFSDWGSVKDVLVSVIENL